MLRGKTLSVPIIHAVHRSKAKDYAMDIQGTTTGFTKLHLKATIISQNVEWRNQAPTIRIRWEITDHHRQILGDMAHRVDWRAYQEFEVTAGQGSGAGGGSAASAGAASPAPPPTDAKGPSDSSSESEDDLSPDKVSIPKKRARKSSDTPPRIMREKDHDASTDEEDHDLLGLADYESEVDSDYQVGETSSDEGSGSDEGEDQSDEEGTGCEWSSETAPPEIRPFLRDSEWDSSGNE